MRHIRISTPAPLEEAFPFENGENWEAAIARHGGVGTVGMHRTTRPDYDPGRTGPKGTSRA
jgi:hypothetical protein